jgi:type I restriction enzyme R subunit
MAQIDSHSTEQVMHGWFPKRLTDLVLDSMTDHEELSMEIFENENSQRAFAHLILRLLSSQNFAQKL